jgi:hypothetical protein
MGILDDLKKEAENKKAQEDQEELLQEERERYMREVLDPAMRGLFTFCHDLAKHLNYVKPDISAHYRLPGVRNVQDFKQGEYFVEDYHEGTFNVRCVCSNNQKYHIRTESEADLERIKDFLWRRGLRYQAREFFDSSYNKAGEFHVEGRVQVDMQFTARLDSQSIELKISNYGDFETLTVSLDPDDIDERFHDELGRFIMRQPNRLMDYNKFRFTDEQRQALREQLREQFLQGLGGSEPPAGLQEEEAAAKPKEGGGSILGNLFRRDK